MKKYILVLILTTLFISPAISEEIENSREVNPEDVIFRSSLSKVVEDLTEEPEVYTDDRYFKEVDPNNMPLFKQVRLRLSNSYLYITNRPKNKTNKISKLKFWENKTKKTEEPKDRTELHEKESDISAAINNAINEPSDSISLEGGINAEKTEKQIMLDSDNITFDEETGDMVATGRPKLFFPPQNTVVTADKMIYNDDGNILKAIGNVIITKDGIPMNTDELEINMNEETMLLDKLTVSTANVHINAEKAAQEDGLMILTNGNIKSYNSYIYRLNTRTVGPDFFTILPGDTEVLFFGDPEKNKLKVHAKYMEVEARKNHDIIQAKKIEFSHNNKVFFKWPSIKMYTNKQHDYFEGNYPEFGTQRKMGMFAGPGITFGGPLGSVIKVIPFVNYHSGDWGIGGMLKYLNTHNRTELGFGSAKNIFFLKGKQRLDDNLFLQYAYNSYTNEWFLGGRMPKYIAELYFDKSYPNKDFLGEGRDLTFRQRVSFGFMKDDNKNYNGENFDDSTNMSTTRTRYMAEINQTIYKYYKPEKRLSVSLLALLQGSAAVYGTGDTQFIARSGPMLRIAYKNWVQGISYFLSGYSDGTPVPHFDAYRYGRSSLHLTEALKINKYLSVGWSGYVNLSDDSPNHRLFQENAFLVAIGSDDCKVVFGYDFIRDRTYFGFNLAFDPKGTDVTYDKLVIKNPERLGKSDNENESQIAFITPHKEDVTKEKRFLKQPEPAKTGVLEYATVIDLEDPDKERIE